MNYTITATYHSWQQFDLEDVFDDIEVFGFEDIEKYEVFRGVLYLTMKDGSVFEYDGSDIDTDFKYPEVNLRNDNCEDIELDDLPTIEERLKDFQEELDILKSE